MYENKTYDTIKADILNNINTVNKNEGSFVNEMISPVSLEIGTAYREFDRILAIMFLENLEGDLLIARAAENGLSLRQGTYAEGSITFTGTNDTVIPMGTVVSTESNLMYVTTTSEIITNGTVTATIKSEDIGSKYNVEANKIINLPVAIVGVSSLTNLSPIMGGSDTESYDSLRDRLLFYIRNPGASGSKNDYRIWTLSVAGVGDTKVFPLANGPGTVEVVIIDASKRAANSTLIESVTSYIESVRPIGARVSVIPAIEKTVNISATLNITSSTTITYVKSLIESKIQEYIKKIAFNSTYVSYAQIGSMILDTEGVIDYTNLELNNTTGNIIVGDKEVATLGTITFIQQS